jgi:hypothetical protein
LDISPETLYDKSIQIVTVWLFFMF